MTREEAIEILYQYSVRDMTYPKEDIEAFELAIKALEQEPCEDAVSRQAVLYALDKRFDSIPMEQTTEILLLRKDLRELPSVTPVRKKGKWIRVDHNKVKCSECEITHLIAQYPHGAINFCPNCGAENER